MTRRGGPPLRGTRFASEETEAAFRGDRLGQDRLIGNVVFTVLALDVALFALTDRGLPGGPGVARWLLGVRVATTLVVALGLWLANRVRRAVTVDLVHLVLSILYAAVVVVVNSTRPRSNLLHLVPEVALIYAGWIFFAGGYLFQAVTSLVFTTIVIVTQLLFRDPLPPYSWANLVLSIVSIHVVGACSSWRLQRSRRLEWLRARELERRDHAKSVFLGTVSHEILAPLGGIVMAADALCRRVRDDEERPAIEAIRNDSDALHALLSDVLDLARGEVVEPRVRPVPVNPRAVLEEVVRALGPRARARGLSVRCQVEAGAPTQANLDPARFRQILVNLVGNAIRFTDSGEVWLRCGPWSESGRRGLLVQVEDSGPGIPPEQQQAVFEPFWQGTPSGQAGRSGAGLGLAVSRRLAERMGGRLEVESRPGAGSRFTLFVPDGPPRSADVPAPPRASGVERPRLDSQLVQEALALAEVPHAGRGRAFAERVSALAADRGSAELRRWAAEVRERLDAHDPVGLAAVLRQLPGVGNAGDRGDDP